MLYCFDSFLRNSSFQIVISSQGSVLTFKFLIALSTSCTTFNQYLMKRFMCKTRSYSARLWFWCSWPRNSFKESSDLSGPPSFVHNSEISTSTLLSTSTSCIILTTYLKQGFRFPTKCIAHFISCQVRTSTSANPYIWSALSWFSSEPVRSQNKAIDNCSVFANYIVNKNWGQLWKW